MYDCKNFMTPIKSDKPLPPDKSIHVRCFTCKKREVCSIKKDYLKTAQLIENIVGKPKDDYEINCCAPYLPHFDGTLVEKPEEYLPTEITSEKDTKATLFKLKYIDSNNFNFVYFVDPYYIIFSAKYNKETKLFDVSDGVEPYYGAIFKINSKHNDDIQLGLATLKEDLEAKEPEEKDVINVTAFSAELNCQFYEWERGLSYEDGLRRMVAQYPDGIKLDDNTYYYLATYHIEPKKTPCYHPNNGKVGFMPMPYPVFIPPKKCCKPPTRDEVNEF